MLHCELDYFIRKQLIFFFKKWSLKTVWCLKLVQKLFKPVLNWFGSVFYLKWFLHTPTWGIVINGFVQNWFFFLGLCIGMLDSLLVLHLICRTGFVQLKLDVVYGVFAYWISLCEFGSEGGIFPFSLIKGFMEKNVILNGLRSVIMSCDSYMYL